MIIVNGAGSSLAQNFISNNSGKEIIAISRNTKISQNNVTSVNINSNDELIEFLSSLNYPHLNWINFQAIKFDDLIVNLSTSDLTKSLEINFFKNFLAAKFLVPKMVGNKFGRFIFIDSAKAMIGDVGCGAYSISKGANRPLMQSIVEEYSRFNITCNSIAIGYADTSMLNSLPEAKKKTLLADTPGKKTVDGVELNSAINFILKNQSVNGHTIFLDGGLTNNG